MNMPHPTTEALHAHRELTYSLSQWAPTVHRLVRERIAALMEAHGRYEHPLETAEGYAMRVLAKGQEPFPQGVCLYDDDSGNSNIAYEHVEIGYGLPEDDGTRITYSGWYPHWAPDGQSYERRAATIHCPGWLVSDPNGVERFRQQTGGMAEAVRRERAAEDARISALVDQTPWELIGRDMAALDAAIGENDIAATGQCCCSGCAGMGLCDRDDRAQP